MGVLFVIVHKPTGHYWAEPSRGTVEDIEQAKLWTAEEVAGQRPMFKFWESEAVPCES